MADAKIGLTIHLLKPDKVASFEDALKKGHQDIRPLVAPLDGEFIPLPSQPGEPPWVDAIRSVLQDPNGLTLDSQSPAGLLVIRRVSNTFVLSFGHASQKLEEQWLEADFGMRAVLNAVPRNKLIEIRAEQVFAKRHIASERAPRASFIEEFGVEFDRDLLAALEGIPSNKELGSHVRGGASLRLQLPFSKLPATLDRAMQLYRSTSYKQRWPEVGSVNPVKDAVMIAALENQFDAELASGQALKRLVLFYAGGEARRRIAGCVFICLREYAGQTGPSSLSVDPELDRFSQRGKVSPLPSPRQRKTGFIYSTRIKPCSRITLFLTVSLMKQRLGTAPTCCPLVLGTK